MSAQRSEFESLRAEILVRVIFQNALLCLTWCALAACLIVFSITSQPATLAVYSVLAVASSAIWAHHGARTQQIRSYLQSTLEPELARQTEEGSRRAEHEKASGVHGGWEHALANMRFRSLLGSRWFVSTKGFLLGSQALIGGLLACTDAVSFLLVLTAFAGVLASIWLLHDPPLETSLRE